MKMKDLKNASQYLMYGSLAAIVLSGIGYLGLDIWLASTQWLLVAVALALFGLYLKSSK
jgi:hypothetical protein